MNDLPVKGVFHFIVSDLAEAWVWEGFSRLERFLALFDGRA